MVAHRARCSPRCARGYTYLIALFAIATSGALLATASVVWHQDAQRAREEELLHVGEEFRKAIGLYYERTPGPVKRYPERLEDLLRDDRYLSLQRYLRRIYRDPVTGKADWGLVRAPGGGIMGVHSLSDAAPIKSAKLSDARDESRGASSYASWRFVYQPPLPLSPVTPAHPHAGGRRGG